MTIPRPIFFIALVCTLVLSFFRYEEIINQKNTPPTITEHEQPEFFLNDALTTRYKQDGSVDYQFNSKHINYYKNSDYFDATTAYFIFFNGDENTWHTRADNAMYLSDNKKMHLSGNVTIWQPARNIELTTDELFFSEKKDYAETDKAVTIQSPEGVTHSIGMNVDLKAERLHLLSDVNGIYHVNQ